MKKHKIPMVSKETCKRVLDEGKLLHEISKAQMALRELEIEVMNYFMNKPDTRG